MNKIIPVVENLFWIDDDAVQHPVSVGYRERNATEVSTTDDLPSVVVQPSVDGYSVVVLAESVEQNNQITEQIVGQFNYKENTNKKGDLKLIGVNHAKHGASYTTEFKILKLI